MPNKRFLMFVACLSGFFNGQLLFFDSLHAQGSAFVANQQLLAILPGNASNLFFVDGELYSLSSGVLFKAQRNGEQIVSLDIDTVYTRLADNVEYVVRHPSGDIFFTSRDKKGRSFLYHCTGFGTKDQKVKQLRMGGGLFNKGMTVEHPTFTVDGNILVFSSNDEKYTEGGYDLWYSLYDGSQWTTPENLGHRVNTDGDELSPLVYRDFLLFSSNGRPDDRGHLSLYSTRLLSDRVTGDTVGMSQIGRCRVQRLPAPLNVDNADDYDLVIAPGAKCGYWLSRRHTSPSASQLYSFSGAPNGMLLWGKVTDRSGRSLAGATVTARHGGAFACSTTTDPDGRYRLYLVSNQHYSLSYQYDGFFQKHDTLTTTLRDGDYLIAETHHDVDLDRLPMGQRIYYEDLFGPDADVELSDRGFELLAPLVRFLNDNPSLKVDLTLTNDLTDNRDFNLMLTDERIRSLENYLYPLLPPTVEIGIENGCIGRDGCNNASGISRLTVLINN